MYKISDIHPRDLVAGITGRYVHGEKASFGVVEIEPGSVLPLHHHPHEQITYILEGVLEMEIGGEKTLLTPGTYRVIPSNTPHSAFAHSACRVIDIFSPVREDYR
jgi:quercetin dioxygenase-like cupin family protein